MCGVCVCNVCGVQRTWCVVCVVFVVCMWVTCGLGGVCMCNVCDV